MIMQEIEKYPDKIHNEGCSAFPSPQSPKHCCCTDKLNSPLQVKSSEVPHHLADIYSKGWGILKSLQPAQFDILSK